MGAHKRYSYVWSVGYFPRDSPYIECSTTSGKKMAKDPLEGVSWQVSYRGKPCYSAYCETEVLIISQDDGLPVADAVPRLTCELSDDDKKQLERLELPQSNWNDDASIMDARYGRDKRYTMIPVEKRKPGESIHKTKAQQIIINTMKASTKSACKNYMCMYLYLTLISSSVFIFPYFFYSKSTLHGTWKAIYR
jgi:hypothetical protein